MIKDECVRPKDVYPNLVRIYRQIVGICEMSSDIS